MKLASLPRTLGLLATFAANMNLAAAQVACAVTERPSSTPQEIDLTDRGEFTIDNNVTSRRAEVHYRPAPYSGYVDWVFSNNSVAGQREMEVWSYMSNRIIACYAFSVCVWLDAQSGCRLTEPFTGEMPTAVAEFSVYMA